MPVAVFPLWVLGAAAVGVGATTGSIVTLGLGGAVLALTLALFGAGVF